MYAVVFLSGRLVADPEVRQYGDSEFVAFRIAANHSRDNVSFFDLTANGELGKEIQSKYRKGDFVQLVANARQRMTEVRGASWNDESRSQRAVNVSSVRFNVTNLIDTGANIVHYSGVLYDDPMLRQTKSGQDVANATLQIDLPNGQKVFRRFAVFGKQAVSLAEYKKKGHPVAIFGAETDSSYEKDGEKRTVVNVTAFQVHWLPGMTREEASTPPSASDELDNLFGGAGEAKDAEEAMEMLFGSSN